MSENQSTDPIDAMAKALAWETLTPKGRAECVWPRDFGAGEVAMFRAQAHAALAAYHAAIAGREAAHG